MPTAELVRDLTLETFDLARERAEDLFAAGTHGVSVAVNQAVKEVREHAPDIDLAVPDLRSHKVRSTVLLLTVLTTLVLLVKKMRHHDEPVPDAPPA
jgi:hypothetical protein